MEYTCVACEDTGERIINNGPDDFDKERCEECAPAPEPEQ